MKKFLLNIFKILKTMINTNCSVIPSVGLLSETIDTSVPPRIRYTIDDATVYPVGTTAADKTYRWRIYRNGLLRHETPLLNSTSPMPHPILGTVVSSVNYTVRVLNGGATFLHSSPGGVWGLIDYVDTAPTLLTDPPVKNIRVEMEVWTKQGLNVKAVKDYTVDAVGNLV
jgi:hypothetical protein